ncbi:MAG: two-component system response regulator [Planctomycetes bacterium RBG_16_64_12]|nr:MAG: two-component system response regulator [Planctomycetes bacterium RBG_16_64_12]
MCDTRETADQLLGPRAGSYDVVLVRNPMRALALLRREEFDGVYVASDHLQEAFRVGTLLENEHVLSGMPDGVVLLDHENTILWSNGRLREWTGREDVVGANFYTVLGNPEILGPDFCPFHTALATGSASSSTLRCDDSRYFHIHVAPVREQDGLPQNLIVTVRDVTSEILQQQKLAAIHQAGVELADLTPEELLEMTVEERIELLKSNILHYTKDLLHFEVVEVRLLVPNTGRLEPLLSEGMEPEAAHRVLYAQPQNNGVTGFVAATGKSYLCEDTAEDPLYVEGARGARSSLTVPLVLHDEVIGTFNVESLEPRAFGESDLQFLEIFGRDVAVALNTLELLVAEKASTAAASVEAIHSAVALPVDEILNDAVNVMERYIGHEPQVVERLQQILRNARDIKQVIQKVGQKMAPAQALPQPPEPQRAALSGRRVLLVDEDNSVRSAAHDLLERYGCVVETAPDGGQAMSMVRNSGYDAIIADIRLPDMSGYQFMVKLREAIEADPLPLILMTGFGYDPDHSIVKARQAGLKAVLYKPFRLDQLLNTVEQIVATPGPVGHV